MGEMNEENFDDEAFRNPIINKQIQKEIEENEG